MENLKDLVNAGNVAFAGSQNMDKRRENYMAGGGFSFVVVFHVLSSLGGHQFSKVRPLDGYSREEYVEPPSSFVSAFIDRCGWNVSSQRKSIVIFQNQLFPPFVRPAENKI